MISFIIVDGEKIEILDKQVFFEEGEKILVEKNEKVHIPYTITSIRKVLRCNGALCDVVQEIHVTT